jgi:hypothetical protein
MFTWKWWITLPAAVTVLLAGGVAACGQTVKPVPGRGTGQLTGARRVRWPRRHLPGSSVPVKVAMIPIRKICAGSAVVTIRTAANSKLNAIKVCRSCRDDGKPGLHPVGASPSRHRLNEVSAVNSYVNQMNRDVLL